MSEGLILTGRELREPPPNYLQAEMALLGILLNDHIQVELIRSIVCTAAFVDPVHAGIYARLLHGAAPLDQLARELEPMLEEVGGTAYLFQLTVQPEAHSDSHAPSDVQQLARVIQGAWQRRLLLDLADDVGALREDLLYAGWVGRSVPAAVRDTLRSALAIASRLAELDQGRPGPVATVLVPPEVEDLADLHNRSASEALHGGEGELHDWHEGRAHELRRMVQPPRVQVASSPPPDPAQHPDAELLAVCAQLREQQAEWRRLWNACPDVPDGGPEDQAFDRYCEEVWPRPQKDDLLARLPTLPATTPEGLRAKAATVLASDEAGDYGDLRDDSIQLLYSVVRDAAGAGYVPLVGDAAPC